MDENAKYQAEDPPDSQKDLCWIGIGNNDFDVYNLTATHISNRLNKMGRSVCNATIRKSFLFPPLILASRRNGVRAPIYANLPPTPFTSISASYFRISILCIQNIYRIRFRSWPSSVRNSPNVRTPPFERSVCETSEITCEIRNLKCVKDASIMLRGRA